MSAEAPVGPHTGLRHFPHIRPVLFLALVCKSRSLSPRLSGPLLLVTCGRVAAVAPRAPAPNSCRCSRGAPWARGCLCLLIVQTRQAESRASQIYQGPRRPRTRGVGCSAPTELVRPLLRMTSAFRFSTSRTGLDWTTQAIGQQHTSPLRAGCEARRREIVIIFGCGNGLARDAPEASKVDGGLRAGGPLWL